MNTSQFAVGTGKKQFTMTERIDDYNLKVQVGFLAVAATLLMPVSIFLQVYTFSYLWLWFIVPLGMPAIGLLHAWGILILKNIMFYRQIEPKKTDLSLAETRKKLVEGLQTMFAVPFIALAVGYIAHYFM